MAKKTSNPATMRFRVAEGRHIHHGREYVKGEVIESAHDLRGTFRNKFILVNDADPSEGRPLPKSVTSAAPETPAVVTTEGVKDDLKEPTDAKPKGADVTDRYKLAEDEDFKVFKSGGKFFVYDGDDLSKPVNAEGVAKDEVDGVIKKALED